MRFTEKILQRHVVNERGKDRVRRVGLTGITTLGVKGISTITSFASIPLASHYLGTERFGIWLILSTLLTWIGIADLGLANSLTNALSSANGMQNKEAAKEVVSTSFYLMLLISFLLTVLFMIFYPIIPWETIFNIKSPLAKIEIRSCIIFCFTFFVLRLPLSIPGRVYIAYQEGYFYQLWCALSSILSFIFLIVSIYFKASLPLLIVFSFGILLLGDILSGIDLFYFRRVWLKPDIKYLIWQKSVWLFKTGFQFWIAQVSAILIFQTDLIIVAQLFGADTVASYGVTLKLFTLIGLIQSAFVFPLWPAYSEALSRNDWLWITKIFKISIYSSFIWSLIAGIFIFIASPIIISYWVNPDAVPSHSLLLAMSFTSLLTSITQCIAMLVNGLGEIKLQAFVAPISAICNLFLSVILGNLIGVSGVAWATCICVLFFSLLAVGGNILRKLTNRSLITKTSTRS